jgi:methylenetetrahydrofolate--tRNA-(uracil-5-)-methyltransferase
MSRTTPPDVTVVGGGMAGCEAAWQLAERGLRVALVEMKPAAMSPAHQTPLLAELVCSNSLRSNDPEAPAGLLKKELRRAGSVVIAAADLHRVPAGDALAVDRVGFGREVTVRLALHPNIRIERRVLDVLPDGPVIMATGPLTGGALAREVSRVLGGERLYFYDAIAPIVDAETIDETKAFRGSRWRGGSSGSAGRGAEGPLNDAAGEGDYVNCSLTREEYRAFVAEVLAGRKVAPHAFEEARYFEGCLPIEVMAERGEEVLAHGPMRPIGLRDPQTGARPWAVVQLRPENVWRTAYNLVGFQTRLAYPEQKRIFRMIPALANAEFIRFGSIHRNTYIDAPRLLGKELELRTRPSLRFAGLLTGVEGYIESCAMGLLAARFVAGLTEPPPITTALGGLYHHITRARQPQEPFAPTNINFGLLPPPDEKLKKKDRRAWLVARAERDFEMWLRKCEGPPARPSVEAVSGV